MCLGGWPAGVIEMCQFMQSPHEPMTHITTVYVCMFIIHVAGKLGVCVKVCSVQ